MTIQELEQCILLYGKDIYSFCMHLAKEKESADDLYQDTFLEATRKIASIRYGDNPKSYLLTSLYNAPCTMPYALKADYELTMRAPVSPDRSASDGGSIGRVYGCFRERHGGTGCERGRKSALVEGC